MADNVKVQKLQIKIDSILGGHSTSTHFAAADQFRASLGIDPAYPIADYGASSYYGGGTGLLRPVAVSEIGASVVTKIPKWLIGEPKAANSIVYVYDSAGSAYVTDTNLSSTTALADGGSLSSSSGNGCAYYDNYIYFAKNTDIARYGPLHGVAGFDGDYWTADLGKAALVNTTYPSHLGANIPYPNHVLHRHSDGRLYIADVVGNRGTIHYIKTKFTAVEGDTDDGSTHTGLQFGYGLWPTAMESYGSDLVVALYEGGAGGTKQGHAKVAFWDTSSTDANKLTWVEYPDTIITAIKNIDGVLYFFSGQANTYGFRITRYVGGYTFEDIHINEFGTSPFAGAVDGDGLRLAWGTHGWEALNNRGCVYSYNLSKTGLARGVFNIMRTPVNTRATYVTALVLPKKNTYSLGFLYNSPLLGWVSDTDIQYGIATVGTDYSLAPSAWWSQTYKIGQPFKITKIRIPLAQAVAANMTVTPKIYFDDGTSTQTLAAIDNTNYPGQKNVVIRPDVATGQHNFWLELVWSGSALCVVGLPITIEYELIDD